MFFFPTLPVLEVGAIAQIEAGHERPPEQRCRRRQVRGALRAKPVGPVSVVDPHKLFDLLDVAAPVVAVQPDPGPVGVQPLPGETRS